MLKPNRELCVKSPPCKRPAAPGQPVAAVVETAHTQNAPHSQVVREMHRRLANGEPPYADGTSCECPKCIARRRGAHDTMCAVNGKTALRIQWRHWCAAQVAIGLLPLVSCCTPLECVRVCSSFACPHSERFLRAALSAGGGGINSIKVRVEYRRKVRASERARKLVVAVCSSELLRTKKGRPVCSKASPRVDGKLCYYCYYYCF